LSYGELLFGSHTEGAVGNGEQLVVPVDGAEGVVVLEVANALTSRAIVDIHVRNAAGHLITSQAFGLRAKSTTHIILDAVLNEQKGSVTIQGNVANSIVAAAFHYRTTSDRSVVYMFGETAREALGASLSASYNTFIGQSCTMELVNSSDSAVPVEVQLYSANGSTIRPTPASAESPVSIPANGSASLDICGYCPHDNYGNAKVIPETPNTISGTLRRRGSENSYVAPIPLLP
jgi:hypothetical protein